jgi:dTDP-4-dehydrorhamnose 3,5-epimerase
LKSSIAQANIAFNHQKGTLRGMHFQFPPAAETKLVRCTRGAILDIIVDLRPESSTYLDHVAVELTAENNRALYVPERFAHGYQVLRDKTETSYQVGEFYAPGSEGGLLYSDNHLGLEWPLPVSVISDKDRLWKQLKEQEKELKQRMGCGHLGDLVTAELNGRK